MYFYLNFFGKFYWKTYLLWSHSWVLWCWAQYWQFFLIVRFDNTEWMLFCLKLYNSQFVKILNRCNEFLLGTTEEIKFCLFFAFVKVDLNCQNFARGHAFYNRFFERKLKIKNFGEFKWNLNEFELTQISRLWKINEL